ncbi:MAG: hypothetical protein IPG12_14900 [Saprospiraceae bacterium]|nr:hypothetical protein [Saprospiraceae bacterium]
MRNYCFIFIILFTACNQSVINSKIPDWVKYLSIYEVMPQQYSESKNLNGITDDLKRIHTMFFTAICLLPIQERDEANNAFNPSSPFAIKSFDGIDLKLGIAKDLTRLIDSAHALKMKVLMEWNFNFTGPHHTWREQHPEYYISDQKMIDNHYNPNYVKLNLENTDLQKKLIKSISNFLREFQFDGVVLFDQDKTPANFNESLLKSISNIRPLVLINHSNTILNGYTFHMNSSFYAKLHQAYDSTLLVDAFNLFVDSCSKIPNINFVHDYLLNEKFGSEVNVFYNAYKYFHTLAFFLPGIHWVLNGTEDPQFDRLSIFSNKPFSRQFKYNNDFFRSMNYQKQKNPALWNLDPENLPKRISTSNDVLALERKSGSSCIVGLFNLTNKIVRFQIENDYFNYYQIFNKVPLNFSKNTELQLGPFQSLLFSNIP